MLGTLNWLTFLRLHLSTARGAFCVSTSSAMTNQPQAISNSPAAPMPPATHIETTTYLTPRRLPSISAWPTSRDARHAEGMADRDAAAIDVELVGIDAERVAAIERLAGEGLVDLPQPDVVDREAGAREQLGNGEDRADPHFLGACSPRPGSRDRCRGSAVLPSRRSRGPSPPAPRRRPKAGWHCPR